MLKIVRNLIHFLSVVALQFFFYKACRFVTTYISKIYCIFCRILSDEAPRSAIAVHAPADALGFGYTVHSIIDDQWVKYIGKAIKKLQRK